MNLKAVLFDLDDTLLWDDRSVAEAFAATCQTASAETGLEADKLEAAVRREARALYESYETFPFTKQIGINPFEGLWANFTGGSDEQFRKLEKLAPSYRKDAWTNGLKMLGVDDQALAARLAEQFPQERRKRPYVYNETFRVLGQLKENFDLLLLTNGAPDLQEEKINGVPGLASYFKHIVISGNFGQGKPSPAIFEYAMQLLNIKADQGLMVGDKLTTDILGSYRAGMRNAWINRIGKPLEGEVEPTYTITDLEQLLAIVR